MKRSQAILLERHRWLDSTLRKDKERAFVSGWQTENPYAAHYIQSREVGARVTEQLPKYQFLSDSDQLLKEIQQFHCRRDQRLYEEACIFPSAGASPPSSL